MVVAPYFLRHEFPSADSIVQIGNYASRYMLDAYVDLQVLQRPGSTTF